MAADEGHRDVTTHRQTAQNDAVQLARIEQARDVVGKGVERRFIYAERATPKATEVGRDDTADVGQRLALRQPHCRVQWEGGQQHQWYAGARRADVKVDVH